MAQGFAQFWEDWGIQILVFLSFTLQVLLLALAGIRRHKAPAALRLLLWLMYQLADSTAIYTLGHMSVASSKAQDQHLVAFWAPFLLVHLGGPGTITAYALEDHRLWLRHLLTLSVQVLGAAFVIYKYNTGGRTLLFLAALLVFVVGVLRYGERTWALWCGNMSSIRSTLTDPHGERIKQITLTRLNDGEGIKVWLPRQRAVEHFSDEELLAGAHAMLYVCKSMLVDVQVNVSPTEVKGIAKLYGVKGMFKVIEMELSLMYDILYTKAAVIHTFYGYCILVISPLAMVAALLLFHSSDKHGDGKVHVAITYALLSGTLTLETISMVRALGSTWACMLMYCHNWRRLLGAITFLRRHIKAASKRRWSGSMGQYNLLHFCTRDRTELGGRLAAKLGLQNWWNLVHYSGTTAISTTDVEDRLRQVFHDTNANSRGVRALESMGLDRNSDEWGYTYWTLSDDVAFDDSILFWHIATDVYLSMSKVEHDQKLVEAVQVLSNYMMFLLVVQPEMLPGPIRQGQRVNTCDQIDRLWKLCLYRENNRDDPVKTSPQKLNMLKKLLQGDEPKASRIPERNKLARELARESAARQSSDATTRVRPLFSRMGHPFYARGPLLAGDLLLRDSESRLEVIFRVWVDMLCYAAHHCSRESHARQLNNGGEFITLVWLLAEHR